MNVRDRLVLRGATVALMTACVLAAPAGNAAADVGSASEQSTEDGAGGPATTRLVLRPVCTSNELHRFAVVNEAGPATQFTVEVAATATGPLAIAPGETVRFWVDADDGRPVEIAWPDGSASATPAEGTCTDAEVPATSPAEQVPAEQPATRPPPASPDRDEQQEPAASTPVRPSASPSADTAPEPDRDPDAADPDATAPEPEPDSADPGAQPATTPGPDEPAVAEPPAAARESGPPGAGRPAPHPSPSGSAFACPDGWLAVDSNGDGTVDDVDECEVLVETGAAGRSSGALFTTAALIVTLGLLIASVVFGAVGRRRMSPR